MTVAKNDVWLKESPIDQIEGDYSNPPYTVVFDGYTEVEVNEIIVFKDDIDVTATVMPTGNHTTSGNRLTMKPLTLLEHPGDYVILISVVVDGTTDAWKCKVRAKKASGEDA